MALDTLLSPVILFFVLGVLAALARSDLAIPEAMAKAMSLYLMAAIGLKGGVQVASAGFDARMLMVGALGMALSFAIPMLAFALLRGFGRLDAVNAGAIAAHYGSVSVVTFATASEVLDRGGIPAAGYVVAVLALMETPAIVSGLMLAQRGAAAAVPVGTSPVAGGRRPAADSASAHLWREVLLNGSVVLLTGAFVIGAVVGKAKYQAIAPLFSGLWSGVLCLFLLDMGLIAVRRLREAQAMTVRLVVLGIAMPLANGAVGMLAGLAIGLGTGSLAALAILCASASYIAVPAAMRLALPQASAGLYLSMSLAVTFPFNIVVGIPIWVGLARALTAGG